MSRRTFTRRFRDRTGSSPQQWLLLQRTDRARLLLESTADSVERIARRHRLRHGGESAPPLPPHSRHQPGRHRTSFQGRG
ncbi:helix-turn-helix domain-containing protein [Nocardia abscessus]|uniref:helix-turn-helix domain-containing protein n=1 Tax=Nocardia abscessus TaxID=120957 RepID=UPI0022391586|nr:helix-turn-helix domain-containing protein [Nocardia abscessus]